jgi:hypothetical protein
MARDLEPTDRRRGGVLSKVDDLLLVGVAVVAVLVVLKIVGFIAGTVFFLVKVAILVGIVFLVLRLLRRGRRS